jgi:hypothetical protein
MHALNASTSSDSQVATTTTLNTTTERFTLSLTTGPSAPLTTHVITCIVVPRIVTSSNTMMPCAAVARQPVIRQQTVTSQQDSTWYVGRMRASCLFSVSDTHTHRHIPTPLKAIKFTGRIMRLRWTQSQISKPAIVLPRVLKHR